MTDEIERLIIGDSPVMRALRARIRQFAPLELPVAILGPTGTGKELVAQALHACSGRRGAFVAANACAITESVFESTVFGHRRGAFTGAIADSAGLLAEAHGGTCFLDEVSGLPLMLQAKLLRAVETGRYRPVGARADAVSSARIVCASNDDLDGLVSAGRFRADLWFRLGAIVVRTPPLAARLQDLPQLLAHWSGDRFDPGDPAANEVLRLISTHAWPGNLRQLRHVVTLALACQDGPLTGHSFREALDGGLRCSRASVASDGEREQLLRLLDVHRWKVSAAAAACGRHEATLYRRLKQYGIAPPRQWARESTITTERDRVEPSQGRVICSMSRGARAADGS